jgi:hypothetical protein
MNKKITLIGGVLATALLAPGMASASFLLDTGAPTGDSPTTWTLNSGQWFAGEFSATAGESIGSVAAYLTQNGSAGSGYKLTFDLYSSNTTTGLFATRATNRSPIASVDATYTADGWTSAALDYTVTTDGNYWLAVQVNVTDQSGSLDLPGIANPTGTAPALGFAYSQNGGVYKSLTGDGVGLQVSTVPLPPGFWLFASGLLGLGGVAGRQRIRHFVHNISAATTGSHAAA